MSAISRCLLKVIVFISLTIFPLGSAFALRIIPPRRHRSLDAFGIYRVEVRCYPKRLPKATRHYFFTDTSITAAHLIAISDENYTGTFPTPDKTKAYIVPYILNGATAGKTNFKNKACNTTFFVPARKKLYLIAASSTVSTHKLGRFWQSLYDAFDTVLAVAPLYTGMPIPTGAGAGKRYSAVKNGEAPTKTFISSFDTAHASTKAEELYQGTQTVRAKYETERISVTRLRSIIDLRNSYFRAAMDDAVRQLFKGKINPADNSDQIATACRAISQQLSEYSNYSEHDIAYSLSVLARTAGLTSTQIIHCLGDEYAMIVATKYIGKPAAWMGVHWGEDQIFSPADVKTVLLTTPRILQPDFKKVAPILDSIMGGMRRYAVKKNPSSKDDAALDKYIASKVRTSDSTGTLDSPAGVLTNKKLMAELRSKGLTRFGCLLADSDSLAMFLALPEAPSGHAKKYQPRDALLMRMWINSDAKISNLEISDENAIVRTVIKDSCPELFAAQ